MSRRQRGVAVASADSDASALVRAERVTRCYRSGAATVVAVRGVTATIAPRARIALTGPSGSGKRRCCTCWPGWTPRPPG